MCCGCVLQAFDALPPGGAFIALDVIIDDSRRSNVWGLLMSLDMMMEFEEEGAADYTFEVGTRLAVWMEFWGRPRPALDASHVPSWVCLGTFEYTCCHGSLATQTLSCCCNCANVRQSHGHVCADQDV